jgi:hypothetical protein
LIVTAFAFQAITSWLLSAVPELFLPDVLSHPKLRDARNARRSLFTLASLREEARRLERDISYLAGRIREKAPHFTQLSATLNALHKKAENMYGRLPPRMRLMSCHTRTYMRTYTSALPGKRLEVSSLRSCILAATCRRWLASTSSLK